MTRKKQLELRKAILPYEKADLKNSVIQMINTIFPFFLFWYLAYESLAVSYLLSIPFILLASGFLVRIFILFHDCCHNSFFKNKKANDILGNITGFITLFAFRQWRHEHNVHHATSGNLNKRGVGDIWVMTVEEYKNASFKQRVFYRVYRNPIVMFGLGPLYLILIANRLNRKEAKLKERFNTYFINSSIVLIYGLMCYVIGWQAFLMVQGPIMFIGAMLGIWLFYVQHHFEDTYFENEEDWDFVKAAVEGSSFYKLPKWLQWITGNIGFHHVHHLSPRVPNYYLEEAHKNNQTLHSVPTVTIRSSFRALQYRLWDEKYQQFISFSQLKKQSKSMGRKLVQKAVE